MNTANRILLVIGILLFAKAVLALVRPEALRKFTGWWLRTVNHVNTLTALLSILIGFAVLSVVLLQQPLVNWILGVFGVLLIYVGTLYFRMAEVKRVAGALVLNRRSSIIRLIGALAMVVAGWIVWVAITG